MESKDKKNAITIIWTYSQITLHFLFLVDFTYIILDVRKNVSFH